MIEAALAPAGRASGDGDNGPVGWEGAGWQCVNDLAGHQSRKRRRGVELQGVNERTGRPFKLKRRPVLLEQAATTRRRQRLNPRQPEPALFAEAIAGRLAAGPAEWRDEQI